MPRWTPIERLKSKTKLIRVLTDEIYDILEEIEEGLKKGDSL